MEPSPYQNLPIAKVFKKFPLFHGNQSFITVLKKIPPLESILSRMKPAHTFIFCLFNEC